MTFEIQIALRFLREGRTQSALIVGGVTVGVAVVVFISALVSGLQSNTIRRTLGAQAHIVAKPVDPEARRQLSDSPNQVTSIAVVQTAPRTIRSINNWQQVIAAFEAVPTVVAVSPMISGAAIAIRGEGRNAVTVFGVDLQRYDRIVDLRDKLVTGSLRLEPGDVLVGTELARDLGADIGDRVTISTGGSTATDERFRITGTVDLGSRELSRRAVFLPLRTAQNLFDLPGGVTSIELRIQDVFSADKVAAQIARITPLTVDSWMTTNSQLLSALAAQTASTTIIRVFVSIVVMLGIASVLVVAVVQKTREIGILRAMGASRGQLTRVFLLQGSLVGLVGSVLGALLATALVFLFVTFIRGADGGPLFPITLEPQLLVVSCLTATVCGTLAAIAPARRAAHLDPAQAMRA
jgi:lipoprotein-releasing system permease protein